MAITRPLTPTTVSVDAFASSTNIPYPTGGLLQGDLLILAFSVSGSSGEISASGWDLIETNTQSSRRVSVLRKWSTGSESGNLSVSHGSGFGRLGGMYALRGVDLDTPLDVAAATGSSTTLASIDTVTDGAWRIDVVMRNNTGSVTPHANHNERWDQSLNANFGTSPIANWLADEEIAAAGSTGTRAITASGTLRTITFAIRPAAAAFAPRLTLLGVG